MANGDFSPQAYENMKVVAGWMAKNGASIRGTKPLPVGRDGLACRRAAKGATRYLFAIPQFKDGGSFAKDYAAADRPDADAQGHLRQAGSG